MKNRTFHLSLLLSLLGIFIWSVIEPKDMFTWFLETLPAILGIGILMILYPKFKFSNLVYFLIWIHCIILIVGAHYTYAEMPLFDWIQDYFDLSRNYYDRVGHFAQGFIPAMIVREILIRNKVIKNEKWLVLIIIFVCLGISAAYELTEFTAGHLKGESAEVFLGTQGDGWDTHYDMLCALCGAIISLLSLSKLHDQSLKKCQLN
ncbi:MAG: DUF2238 domain-containing protein [Anaerovorax sp.]|nr:DUF2238 domain-containing protein [Anaerovorax sp.]